MTTATVEIVQLHLGLLNALQAAEEEAKRAQRKLDNAKAAIIAALEDNEAGAFSNGLYATYREVERSAYICKATKFHQLKIVEKL